MKSDSIVSDTFFAQESTDGWESVMPLPGVEDSAFYFLQCLDCWLNKSNRNDRDNKIPMPLIPENRWRKKRDGQWLQDQLENGHKNGARDTCGGSNMKNKHNLLWSQILTVWTVVTQEWHYSASR